MLQIGSIILVLWLGVSIAHSSNATTTTPTNAASTKYIVSGTLEPLCPSRTINYITHTLPQQCLRTSRSTLSNATTASSTDDAVRSSTCLDTSLTHGQPCQVIAETASVNGTSPQVESSSPHEPGDTQSFTPTVTTDPPTSSAAATPTETDHDSPLDDSKFLSFEEWKKQNLAKLRQSPDNNGQGRSGGEGRRRPINNALDSLGDEGEIEIDFGGFGSGKSEDSATGWLAHAGPKSKASDALPSSESLSATTKHRSKDAGKTCKERFNYASFDCAATILKTNPQCKSSSSVLVENKDSYMLNECSSPNKFLILELCDDILVDTIVLANFEFFSSMFRTIRVSVTDRYPVKLDGWRELGTFEARNTREIQAFLVEHPLIWARYLRIEFLTHYGNEFYCPVSLVRVHGTTMMEEVRHNQEDGSRSDDDIEEEIAEPESLPATQDHQQNDQSSPPSEAQAVTKDNVQMEAANATAMSPELPLTVNNLTEEAMPETSIATSLDLSSSAELSRIDSVPFTTRGGPHKISALLGLSEPTAQSQTTTQSVPEKSSPSQASSSPAPVPDSSSANLSSATASSQPQESKPSDTTSQTSIKADGKPARSTADVVRQPPLSASQPPPPQPTTQESFFKSTSKRLLMLETNSSLNIQYIEEQSRILRDAFIQTEKQQLKKTENFLLHLNDTVMTELKGFRQQYDQLWQSTVIELETHREQYQREMLAISSRLTIMADELVFQKRMIVVQSTLLALCLGLIIFVRSGSSYMELPLMQQMMSKSHNMLKLSFDSPPESPSSRRTSPLRSTRRLIRISSGTSEGSLGSPSPDRHDNPSLRFSPPTPSDAGRSERSKSPTLNPEDVSRVRGTRSGPATPSGTRENQIIEWDTPNSVVDEESPLLKARRSDPPAGHSLPSSLRYSGSSEFDEDANVEHGTAERQDQFAASKAGRSRKSSPRATASGGSSMSDFDGDTAGEFMFADGISD